MRERGKRECGEESEAGVGEGQLAASKKTVKAGKARQYSGQKNKCIEQLSIIYRKC